MAAMQPENAGKRRNWGGGRGRSAVASLFMSLFSRRVLPYTSVILCQPTQGRLIFQGGNAWGEKRANCKMM